MKIAVLAAGLTVALALAPSAHADTLDYLVGLDNQGVPYSNAIDVINLGKMTCSRLRAGSSVPAASAPIILDAGYSGPEAVIITYAAVNFLCIDQLPAVQRYARGGQ